MAAHGIVALGIVIGLTAAVHAQSLHSLSGTVRNAVTGDPVKNALVLLEPMVSEDILKDSPAPQNAPAQNYVTLSGPAGDFRFGGISKGRYAYHVQKEGFAQFDPASTGELQIPGQSTDPVLQLKLTPFGTIEGRAVDQFGEPAENVVFNIYRLAILDGERKAQSVGSVWTDDRGEFHLAWLDPGNYVVKAEVMRGGTETHFGLEGMRYAPWESFSPVYFGGATDVGSATPIAVAAGARARTDFRLEMQPSFRIRGRLAGYEPSEPVRFQLLREDQEAEPIRTMVDPATGAFVVVDVTKGTYTLRVSQEHTRGELPVNVGGADLNDISVALSPPISIKSSTRMAGGLASGAHPPGSCRFALQERGEYGQYIPGDAFPGVYRALLQCSEGYPRSATLDGRDLLTNPIVAIEAGAPPQTVEIEFTPGGGILNAKLEIPTIHAAILLVPAFLTAEGPYLKPVYYSGMEPSGGVAVFQNLRPGDYTAYAFRGSDDIEFRNPEFLRTLSRGASVHIEDGKASEVTITSLVK